jgi:four helix bundle protein
MMKDFRSLKVWEKAHELVLEVYRESARFPKEELFGLRAQLRRAALSIPTNIAEGSGRGTDRDFARFVQIAMGSACEAEYLLLLSRDLAYLGETYLQLEDGVQEVKRMLAGLLRRLNAENGQARLTAES